MGGRVPLRIVYTTRTDRVKSSSYAMRFDQHYTIMTTYIGSIILVRVIHLPARCRENMFEAVIPGALDNLSFM